MLLLAFVISFVIWLISLVVGLSCCVFAIITLCCNVKEIFEKG
jgi:hypothetical protein